MSLPSQTVWEVRPTVGSDLNGGLFVAGASGTDFSQQNSPQLSNTDLVIDAADNTKVSSAGATLLAAHIGNGLQISAGTGFTTGIYRITAVSAGVATLDRACGTTSSTGGTFRVGGALATLTKVLTVNTGGNKIFIKDSGTLVTTATHTLNNNETPGAGTPLNWLEGYGTTRGDSGRPTIQLSTNSNLILLDQSSSAAGWFICNLILDCNNLTGSKGIKTGFFCFGVRIKIMNFKSHGIENGGDKHSFRDCEITGGNSGATAAITDTAATGDTYFFNYIHDNVCPGMLVGSIVTIGYNIFYNNSGASSDGIVYNSQENSVQIFKNIFYGNGRDGINLSGSNTLVINVNVWGNICISNGRYGINGSFDTGNPALPFYDGNAFYNNTSGARNKMDDIGSQNPVNAAAPYTNIYDVTLSVDPFVNAAGGDFTLDPTDGILLLGTGLPQKIGNLSSLGTGFPDFGPIQHQDAGGGGGMLIHPGMSGGIRG